MPEPDESTLQRLLGAAERPREMTDDERQRILARLSEVAGSAGPTTGAPVTDDLIQIDASATEHRPRHRALTATLLGAAAAVLFVVVLATRADRPDSEPAPAATPLATVPTLETAWCRSELEALTEAVEQWRGVEDWAFSLNGLPDLAGLTERALDGLGGLAPAAAVSRLDDVSDRLTAEVPHPDVAMNDRDRARARETAVTDAIADLVDVGLEVVPECSFERLVTAVPLSPSGDD